MGDDSIDPAAQLIDKLREILSRQKWYQKYSNTVVTTVGALIQFAVWITSLGLDLPKGATLVVSGLLLLGQIVGIKATRNGVTPRLIDTVAEHVNPYGRHARRDG